MASYDVTYLNALTSSFVGPTGDSERDNYRNLCWRLATVAHIFKAETVS